MTRNMRWYIAGSEEFMIPAEYEKLIVQHLNGKMVYDKEEDFDVMLFTGGADINPKLYGMEPHPTTGMDKHRDGVEIYEFWTAYAKKVRPAFVGICRGAQFLNVMNGGTLFQNVNNHTHDHKVAIVSGRHNNRVAMCSSTHHQQMVFPTEERRKINPAVMIGVAKDNKATQKEGGHEWADKNVDIEIMHYPKTRSLCFQPHPEFSEYKECRDLFIDLVRDYIYLAGAA